ncbi:MAG: MFS transporter, partial [bacterium]
VTFFFATVSPFFHRTEFTIIPQIVEKEMLLKANGILSGSKRFMQVISPPLAGVFISIFGVASCFLLDALSFFVSILCIIPIAIKSISGSVGTLKNKHFFLDIKEGYNILVRSRFLLILAIYAMCINFLGAPIFPLLPLLAEKIRFGSSGYGFMMGAFSAGLIASSLFVGFIEKFLKAITILLFGLIVSATAIGLMGLSSISVIIIIASFMMGMGINLSNLPIVTLFQKNIPETKIGVVSSFVFTFGQIAMPVSMLLSGFLVDVLSLRGVFVGVSLFLLIGALLGFALPVFKEPESKIGFDIQGAL